MWLKLILDVVFDYKVLWTNRRSTSLCAVFEMWTTRIACAGRITLDWMNIIGSW